MHFVAAVSTKVRRRKCHIKWEQYIGQEKNVEKQNLSKYSIKGPQSIDGYWSTILLEHFQMESFRIIQDLHRYESGDSAERVKFCSSPLWPSLYAPKQKQQRLIYEMVWLDDYNGRYFYIGRSKSLQVGHLSIPKGDGQLNSWSDNAWPTISTKETSLWTGI